MCEIQLSPDISGAPRCCQRMVFGVLRPDGGWCPPLLGNIAVGRSPRLFFIMELRIGTPVAERLLCLQLSIMLQKIIST